MGYRAVYSTEASSAIFKLSDARRANFDRALTLLLENPFDEHSTEIFGDKNARKIVLTPYILIEYVVSGGLLILVVVNVFDLKDIFLNVDEGD